MRSDTANCGWVLDLLAAVAANLGAGDKVAAAISKAIQDEAGEAPAAPTVEEKKKPSLGGAKKK